MTIFEDPLYQKYLSLSKAEEYMRKPFVAWMNTMIPYFDIKQMGNDIIEVRSVTYVQDSYSSEFLNIGLNPNAILRVIIKTDFGFNDSVRRIPFTMFGSVSDKLLEEFQYFINFRKFYYELCKEIEEKYKNKFVTDGEDTYKITKIEYHAMPLFYSRPNILEERIKPMEFYLK